MKGVAIGRKLFLVAAATGCGGLGLPLRGSDLADLMRCMAIDANRRGVQAGLKHLAVNARGVITSRSCVACPAGSWNVGCIGTALWILAAQNRVGAVATRATGCHQQTVFG